MSKIPSNLRFTVIERILLHLLDYTNYRNKIEVPPSITQQGISQCIRIERKHLPRSLKAMIEKNLVIERKTHVIDKNQRMKTYYLTLNGEAKASELKEGILNLVIKLKDEKGLIKERRIGEIKEFIKGVYSLAEILSWLQAENIFNLKQTLKEKEKIEEKTSIDKINIYRQALAQAWKDGKMTRDELDLLHSLRVSLNISEKNHVKIEKEILEKVADTADDKLMEIYSIALKQALTDNRISKDERAILEKIKNHMLLKK